MKIRVLYADENLETSVLVLEATGVHAMMRSVLCIVALIFVSLAMVQCQASPSLASIEILPDKASLTYVGQTIQYKAIGTYLHVNHPSFTRDITNEVTWQTSNPGAATINSTGLATAVAAGTTQTTTIMASTTAAFAGNIQGTTTLTVSGQAQHDLNSITVIPNNTGCTSTSGCPQIVAVVGGTAQFLAIGNYNTAPLTEDITDQVTWTSSAVQIATVDSTGLALAVSVGQTTITALGRSNSGADIAGTSNLTVQASGGGQVPTLTVSEVGLGTGTATSFPVGINCTSNVGCSASFVIGTTVTLTAVPATGSTFGGWSSNCTTVTATSCSIILNSNTNEPVAAIFNQLP